MSINFLKFIKVSAKMHPGVYVHVTCNLIYKFNESITSFKSEKAYNYTS